MNTEITTKRLIYLIIESPRLGFWRICGKDTQKKYRRLVKEASSDDDYNKLLDEVVSVYTDCINKMECVKDTERIAKLHTLNRYADRRI